MTRHPLIRTALSFAIAGLLAACGDTPMDGNPLETAKAYLAKNEFPAAEVSLKAALQADPTLGEARYLMGQMLVRGNAFDAAVVELGKARDLGYQPTLVVPLLARAMLGAGNFKAVASDFEATKLQDPVANADVAVSVATAWAMQGNAQRAETLVDAVLQASPGSPAALLAKARLQGSRGQVDEALSLTDRALNQAPQLVEGQLLKGDLLLYGKKQLAPALAAYQQAVALDSMSLNAHVSALTALLMTRDVAASKKQFALLKSAYPGHPQTQFFEAQFTLLAGDHKAAREQLAELMRAAPDNVRLLVLAGANELALGDLALAEALLAKAIKADAANVAARRVLAQVHMRSGQMNKVIEVLEPVLAKDSSDIETLYLAAIAQYQAGDPARADAYLARAAKINPAEPKIRTAQALQQMARGDVAAGFAALEAVAASDKGEIADMALIAARLRRGEYDAALTAIDALDKKLPNQPFVYELRAQVQLGKRDVAGARASLDRAVALAPTFFPAISRLVSLDLRDNKPDQARQRLEAVLKADSRQLEARLALVGLLARQGASVSEVVQLYREAQAAHPRERLPRLMLAEYLLTKRMPNEALEAARAAASAFPDDPQMLDLLGRAQAASGDSQQAISTYYRLATLQPDSPKPLVRLAGLFSNRRDYNAAATNLKKALDLDPNMLLAQQGLIQLSLAAGKPDVALDVAKSMQQKQPTAAFGYALEGDIQRQRKRWVAAREAYLGGIGKVSDKAYLATKLHSTYLAEGKPAEADRFARDWMAANPSDATFSFHLGMLALGRQDNVAAEQQFRAVVDKQPDNARAVNNLAWVTSELGKPGALEMVGRALALMPDQPDFLDTQAHVLAKAGQTKQALESQRQAVALAPDNTGFRLNLIQMQIRAGDTQGARAALEQLAASAPSAAVRAEASRLMANLP